MCLPIIRDQNFAFLIILAALPNYQTTADNLEQLFSPQFEDDRKHDYVVSVQDGSKEFNHNQLPNQKLDEFDELDEGGPYKDENEIYDDDNRINMDNLEQLFSPQFEDDRKHDYVVSVQDGSKEFNHNQLPNQKLDEFDELDEGGPYKDENEIYDDDNRINMGESETQDVVKYELYRWRTINLGRDDDEFPLDDFALPLTGHKYGAHEKIDNLEQLFSPQFEDDRKHDYVVSVQDGSKEFNHNQLPNQKLDEFDELDEGGPYKDENEIYDDDNRINMGESETQDVVKYELYRWRTINLGRDDDEFPLDDFALPLTGHKYGAHEKIACRLSITAKHGHIRSPRYPDNYPKGTSCLWMLHGSPSAPIQLDAMDFEPGSMLHTSDGLELWSLDMERITYLGTRTVFNHFDQVISGEALLIKFRSNLDLPTGRFDLRFRTGNVRFEQQASILHCPVPIDFFAAIAPSIQQCSGYFSHNAGEITLSNYKLALGESTSCLWLIDANSDEYIRMNLEEFGMNDDMHDVLEIWTMGEQEMWCIDVYHRFHRPTVGLRFDQPVLVYYHSDGIGSHPNFRAKYEKIVSNVDFRLTNLEGERAELSSESHPQSLISGPYKQSSSEADYSQTNEGQ
ncbi:hypothetical protein FBUS_01057 [Fasciolopsis buskii]|uniref:CUB domain-containing protein n=1 Tax=Fasciolopsis buskii TaxID=27845 RepID=A0A8E0S1M9_9TREM|nr:hypothetical protein FBUS_01057 [Fasciolopsis buski]